MPRLLKRFLLRVRATLSAQQDRDTRAELDLHLRLLEEEYLAKGVAPERRTTAGAARVRQPRRVPGRQPRPLLVPPDRGSRPRSALCRPRDAAVRRLHRHRGGIARRRHRRRHRDIRRDRGRHAAAAPRAQP